ncbi:uncharacterized protein BT62DRAFT_984252 [Guyanagaster necrorhizus]|uniref:AP complex subunit beta n=1 Tax=Guyanagaster necrorhizus TaxID=856835 RepID=A0A9P8AYH8_9AGAR|nr:uncharacterized protein BT62DRAFT_984252 [Guyanagaster necrorhizus MCA 3950]KAG7450937.1 hypothetical protein BT62DRAFT_984252 [Guyanagaster necrorhizus MCA 3950]
MSGEYLNSITENASRLGLRLQESLSEHTRDIARGRTSPYYDSPDDKGRDIRKQLDSSSDREKLDAMKRLIALISKGRNVSEYFAQVVKNVASQNLEIRKLVYIYLLRYAEQEPDLALLSINTFQKDLTDSNPLIRAMALRVLSGIKVPMIGNIVVLAIKKCAADISPYVRKVAALAIPKCYDLDTSHLSSLIEIIITLLRDRSPLSIGSVAVAFDAICPTRLDLLHKHYRRLCKTLVDVDEWGQINLLDLLLRYSRSMLLRPVLRGEEEDTDKDVKLLLNSAEPLFFSRNPAVVLAAARVLYYAGPPSYHAKIVQPLVRLLSVSKEIERVALAYILIVASASPGLFSPFYSRFILSSDDLRQVKIDKIKMMLIIVTFDNYPTILREFIDYAEDIDDEVAAASIRAIGRCAGVIPESVQQSLTALIGMINSQHDTIINAAVVVLKNMVQAQLSSRRSTILGLSQSPLAIISQLAQKIDSIRNPQARACVVWLVGQYAASEEGTLSRLESVTDWAPDVLRKMAKTFSQEESVVKLQVVTLAAKLFVLCPVDRTLGLLNQYIFLLARYDTNYDVRDRARILSSLLSGIDSSIPVTNADAPSEREGVVLRREQVKMVLFEGKAGVIDVDPVVPDPHVMLGSSSAVTGKPTLCEPILPDWLEKGVESSLRDTEEDIAPPPVVPTALSSAEQQKMRERVSLTPTSRPDAGTQGTSSKVLLTDLDRFYEEEEESEEDESESDEESGDAQDDEPADDSTDEGSADESTSEDEGRDRIHRPSIS